MRHKINVKRYELKLGGLNMNPQFTIYLVCILGVVCHPFPILAS